MCVALAQRDARRGNGRTTQPYVPTIATELPRVFRGAQALAETAERVLELTLRGHAIRFNA